MEPTSPQVPSPFTMPGNPAPLSTPTFAPPSSTKPSQFSEPPKTRTNWLLCIVFLLIGLLLGGLAGYFVGDLLVFTPRLNESETARGQLESRVAVLENQLAQLQQSGTSGGSSSKTTPGTGTAPSISGITPDPKTADWQVYTDTEHHLSFRYPIDYEVKVFENSGDLAQLNDDKTYLGVGIFKKGEAQPAGMVYLYTPEGSVGSRGAGPTHSDLQRNRFVSHLPTQVLQESAGAGLINTVAEQSIILNGTDGIQLSAQEGSKTTQTPGGSTYTGYLLENKFSNTYLTSACDSDQSTQPNIVGCLFLTTVSII
ncbi:MAG: hypothetical protein U0517_02900 [Candidatus Andersenbacteria bacterium]